MRKRELVHLHALCCLLRARVEAREGPAPEAFRAYDERDLSPTAIHRRKRDHREAITLLLDGLETVFEDPSQSRGPAPQSTDS